MDYVIDLAPVQRVLRLTVTAPVTDELAEDCYRTLSRVASQGGPYAAIFDLSGAPIARLTPQTVRAHAAACPRCPGGQNPRARRH
jgi:hypothetical protein